MGCVKKSQFSTLELFEKSLVFSSAAQHRLEEGAMEHSQRMILRLGRQKFGPASDAIVAAIKGITNLERFERLFDRILTVSTWDELVATP